MTQQKDTLTLKDGTSMELIRIPDIDDNTWADVKTYLEANPDSAKFLQSFAHRPDAVRSWVQTHLIMGYYHSNIPKEGDNPMEAKFKALAEDPELAPLVAELKRASKEGNMEPVMKMFQDEELALKFNAKMGGLPQDLGKKMQRLAQSPISLHEAAKRGDLDTCKAYITKHNQAGVSVDSPDPNGITALGFAIGANRAEVVKLLLTCKANLHAVDANGNAGAHYAAGYGRKEMLEFLLAAKSDPNQKNGDGKSPIDMATQNKQESTIEVLKKAGAQ